MGSTDFNLPAVFGFAPESAVVADFPELDPLTGNQGVHSDLEFLTRFEARDVTSSIREPMRFRVFRLLFRTHGRFPYAERKTTRSPTRETGF